MKLEDLKVPELREKAHALGIEGVDALKKAELIEAIKAKSPDIEQPKGLIEKAKDLVDSVLHPDKPAEESAPESAAAPAEQSSSEESDLAKHPKFAKFKSQGEKP